MQDGSAFVNAVFARVNPIAVGERLLTSEDEKVAQRSLERFLEMKFGKGSASFDEPLRLEVDIPRPNRE
jgi:hypothetical protein